MDTINQKLTDEELKIITEVLDEVMTKYEENSDYILEKDSDKKSFAYRFKGLFPQSRTCIIPRCNNRSITNSHTIQKAHSLTMIAENHHVYSPLFNKKTGELGVKRLGVNQASTFPGFCSKHEGFFHNFEKSKNVDSDEAVALQIFRTIARELVVKESGLQKLVAMKERYLKFREKRILELFFAEVKKKIPKMKEFPKSCSIDYDDEKLAIMNGEIAKLSSGIDFFNSKFFIPLYESIFLNDHSKFPLYIYKIDSPNKIPICLAGRGTFHVKKNGIKHKIHAILNILPLVDKTMFYVSGELKNKEFIDYYVANFQRTALPGLNLAETWMVRGSDHWFIQPSVWDALDDDRKKQVLKDTLDVSFNIADNYKYSIFNSLRKEIINFHKDDYENADVELKEKVNFEISKL